MGNQEFREGVSRSEAFHTNIMRDDAGLPIDTQRENMPPETSPETVARESLFRETVLRDAMLREQPARETAPPTNREDANREAANLNRTPESPARIAGARLSGTPLSGNPLPGSPQDAAHRPPPGRALVTAPAPAAEEDSSAMQRAMGLLKSAAPFVARLLPLIEGNVAAAVTNLIATRPSAPAAPVDLAPVHNQLAEIQLQHNDLRGTVQEQTTALKRVEDRLDQVREATDRNTLEQQELIGDLKAMGTRVSRIALGISILLLVSIAVNLWLYLYIKKVLP